MGNVVAVIVAAGGSARLGRPKQLVRLGGERLLDRAVRVASAAGCEPIVVLGAAAEEIRAACGLSRCRVVENPGWREGMAGSIRAGVEAALGSGVSGAVVMTCDQPAVTTEHLLRLVAAGAADELVASSYAGRKGVPAYFPASHFRELLELEGDAGARGLLSGAKWVELARGEIDIDTEDKLRWAEEMFG
jgi:CTP:molybdopterin cytidylyltransferase MocA